LHSANISASLFLELHLILQMLGVTSL
jgi:hypothetical protein